MKNSKTIAITGKGGVGKTSISALIIKLLIENKPGAKILAIDADPAIGLSTALGVDVGKTIDDIRKEVIEVNSKGVKDDTLAIINNIDYEILDAMIEEEGFAFLAVGRPESAGCYCKVNSYLKQVIEVLASKFDYVIIDGEAGIEQINRRVMEKVTHLISVSDASKKGIDVIKTIRDVSRDLVSYGQFIAIVNRISNKEIIEHINLDEDIERGYIFEDDNIRISDIKGDSLLSLLTEGAVISLKEILERINIL